MEKSDFFTMPKLSINNINFDMAKSNVVIEKILTQKGAIHAYRLNNGELNINMFTGNNNKVVQENDNPVTKEEQPFLVTVNNSRAKPPALPGRIEKAMLQYLLK